MRSRFFAAPMRVRSEQRRTHVGTGSLHVVNAKTEKGVREVHLTPALREELPPGKVEQNVTGRISEARRLDHALVHTTTYLERLRLTAEIFDHRYGTNESVKVKQYVSTEGEARRYYEELRPQLYPTYSEWDSQVQHLGRAARGATRWLIAL